MPERKPRKAPRTVKTVFVIEADDNVGTAVGEELIRKGDTVTTAGRVTDVTLKALADIPYGHKIALRPIRKGQPVIKYGLSIGTATANIKAGDHVHIHNVESNRGRGDLTAKGKVKT